MEQGTFIIDGMKFLWKMVIGPAVIIWSADNSIRFAVGLPPTVVDLPSLMAFITIIGIRLVGRN